MVDLERLLAAHQTVRSDLLAETNPSGHWTGCLSSSALSTATAVSALAIYRQQVGSLTLQDENASRIAETPTDAQQDEIGRTIIAGLRYLAEQQNEDGGWGDTDRSQSNLATTMLARSAFQLTGVPSDRAELVERADAYIAKAGGVRGLRKRYGKDKSFAVPILMNCALAGLVRWRDVSALPFEVASMPRSWFRLLRLPVVSYAIPALIAVGFARFRHAPPINPLLRWIRKACVRKSFDLLEKMQPASGGYLEATPLTSFVVMSLASTGKSEHIVAERGVEFLLKSMRPDGSWPIDTNLATWVTSLSVNALGEAGQTCPTESLPWLLECQQVEEHPYTEAKAGGWAWTDLSGGVPDVDDTSGALLALPKYERAQAELAADNDATELVEQVGILTAAKRGLGWLLEIQNSDGGWPTFCRGWGKLPFDRSGTDLTAHAIRALNAWSRRLSELPFDSSDERAEFGVLMYAAIERGMNYLEEQQREDGSWAPLWFGNEQAEDQRNYVYGTSRVLLAYRDLGRLNRPAARRGFDWLLATQDLGGGWGGGGRKIEKGKMQGESSVEETALALSALFADPLLDRNEAMQHLVSKGLAWLIDAVEEDHHHRAAAIGLYFAKLWYHEALYPLTFTVSALAQAVAKYAPESVPGLESLTASEPANREPSDSPNTEPSRPVSPVAPG